MTRYWKIIAVIFAVLLLAGIVLGGAGYLTGASPDRIAELAFGGWDAVIQSLESLYSQPGSLY